MVHRRHATTQAVGRTQHAFLLCRQPNSVRACVQSNRATACHARFQDRESGGGTRCDVHVCGMGCTTQPGESREGGQAPCMADAQCMWPCRMPMRAMLMAHPPLVSTLAAKVSPPAKLFGSLNTPKSGWSGPAMLVVQVLWKAEATPSTTRQMRLGASCPGSLSTRSSQSEKSQRCVQLIMAVRWWPHTAQATRFFFADLRSYPVTNHASCVSTRGCSVRP